jgi:putative ABC transport system permease protein
MNLVTIAVRNAARNKFRAAFTVLGAVVSVLAFVLLRTVLNAWNVGAEHAAKDRLAVRHKISFSLPIPKRYVETVRTVPGVEHACFFSFFGGKNPKYPTESFSGMAADAACLDVMDDLVIPPDQVAAWLANRQGAIVGDLLARKLDLKIGDKITLEGTLYPGQWSFEVVAIYTAIRKSVERSAFVLHWEYLNDSVPEWQRDQVGWINAKITDPSRAPAISDEIDRLLGEKDIPTKTMSERAAGVASLGEISALLTALEIVSAIILVIMTMIVGNTIISGIRERTREYGVLQAIGFRPHHVIAFIVGEAATMGLLAGALGVAIAYAFIGKVVGPFLEDNLAQMFPYVQMNHWTAVAALFLATALPVAVAIVPAYQTSRRPVIDSLRRVA